MKLSKSSIDKLDFNKGGGLIPAIIQNDSTGQVLMLGYMNREALEHTFDSGKVTFYSRKRQEIWTKGVTSGNFLILESIWFDCDHDSLLIKANPLGPTCHLGSVSCFTDLEENFAFLKTLETIVRDRRKNRQEASYTAKLFNRGVDKIAQKVGEEAVELIIEAKNDDLDSFLGEAADLLFHLMVLFEQKGTSIQNVINVLEGRHK